MESLPTKPVSSLARFQTDLFTPDARATAPASRLLAKGYDSSPDMKPATTKPSLPSAATLPAFNSILSTHPESVTSNPPAAPVLGSTTQPQAFMAPKGGSTPITEDFTSLNFKRETLKPSAVPSVSPNVGISLGSATDTSVPVIPNPIESTTTSPAVMNAKFHGQTGMLRSEIPLIPGSGSVGRSSTTTPASALISPQVSLYSKSPLVGYVALKYILIVFGLDVRVLLFNNY
jgi:hypothetical protein